MTPFLADLHPMDRAPDSAADRALDQRFGASEAPALPKLASARLYQHPAFRQVSASELVPAVLERAECNGIDALDSDDPVNALCDAGFEQDCWLEPIGNGGRAGHLDSLLIDLIRDVRRLERAGMRARAEREAHMRVLQIGDQIIDWMRHSASPQATALEELYAEYQDRAEVERMTAAGV